MFSDSMSEISYSAGRIPQRLARWGVCILPFFVAPTSGTADDENIEENISSLVLSAPADFVFSFFPEIPPKFAQCCIHLKPLFILKPLPGFCASQF
jgi:hypothetical protein